ncbi:MAG: hypothetical protein ACYDAC_09230 [Candidatus Dormibacteria bacterium]
MTEARYRPADAGDFHRLYRASYRRMLHTLAARLRDPAAALGSVGSTLPGGRSVPPPSVGSR